ncbi:MAG: hypothetical protein G01um101425_97 [Candidatus Peregrinibacteria bacterium Gr01-1014_25]|nr:MAG: hypothetical protein G01um101425_97 [Candidatus Peregrinibacteria bacterium Gr01-1014_25]
MSALFPGIGGDRPFLVAEIGKNFIQTPDERPVDECIHNAIVLIDAATDAGADAVKFQTHVVDDEQMPLPITSPHAKELDRYAWVSRNTRATPRAFWDAITGHCKTRGITFFSTPMSRGGARVLQPYDPPFWKVSSGDVLDFVLLDTLRKTGKPVILSTGMVSRAELRSAVDFLAAAGSPIGILYCISEYPCPPETFNLATIPELHATYPDAVIGFSDHSLGFEAAMAASALGAVVIEKHFSLSRDLWGPDHKVSMTPTEFSAMAEAVRSKTYERVDSRSFLGQKDREFDGATNRFRPYFHKALVAGQDIPAGAILTGEEIMALRPASMIDGLSSQRFPDAIGKTTIRDHRALDPITISSFH